MKKLWSQNRVVMVLLVVLVICFIAIICVTLSFFYKKDSSEYGQRLDDIANYPIKADLKVSLKEYFENDETVTKYDFNLKGRIIYINLSFDEVKTLDKAKALVEKSLELFDEETLSYYDVMYILESDNFTIIGAKNSVVDHISWNNNKKVEPKEDEK